MHKIDHTGGKARLEADTVLTPADFARIAAELGETPVRARKVGYVAARKATKPEVIETHADGKETTNTARPGDFIVTNLTPQGQPLVDGDGRKNIYVITAKKFPDLYEPTAEHSEHGAIYRAKAKGVVSTLPLPGGFDIQATWGERQTGASGYLILNGDEVYASSAEAFEETYATAGP